MDFLRFILRLLKWAPGTPLPLVKVSVPIVATGYTVPLPPTGVSHSRDLKDCEPDLAHRYLQVAAEFKTATGRDLFITCTWRSKEEQASLYAKGRTAPGAIVTNIDGVKVRSRHNFYPSQAIDVCVDVKPADSTIKQAVWEPAYYAPLGPLCKKYGLEWGGDFKTLKDFPHLQLPAKW